VVGGRKRRKDKRNIMDKIIDKLTDEVLKALADPSLSIAEACQDVIADLMKSGRLSEEEEKQLLDWAEAEVTNCIENRHGKVE